MGQQNTSSLRSHEAILLLGAVAVGWGTAWPVIKAILQDVPPLWTLLLRSLVGSQSRSAEGL